ncbi:hypothetical protein [Mucilaginibacter sp.]
MKIGFLILLTAGLMLVLPSCNKSSFVQKKIDSTTDVYITGYIYKKALYWKNDTVNYLNDADVNAEAPYASSIFVSDNNNVYVAGSDMVIAAGDPHRAICWKNGQITYLTNAQQGQYADASSVFVSNNDVYVGGYLRTNGNSYPTYWKNGTANIVGTVPGTANSVFVSGSDIYVGGYAESQPGKEHAAYWKNGAAISLSTDNAKGTISSVIVSGGHVYAAGYTTFSDGQHATYWKDGTVVELANSTVNSGAASIFVSGNDIYVAGDQLVNGIYSAVYWKNNVQTTLSTRASAADAICVSGNDVYVAGQEMTDTAEVATYWKNGTVNYLPNSSIATSIFVKKR